MPLKHPLKKMTQENGPTVLFEVNYSPRDPLLDFLVLEHIIHVKYIVGVNILAKQESVNECLNLRILALRQLAVAMLTLNGESHAVLNAELLPYLTGSNA